MKNGINNIVLLIIGLLLASLESHAQQKVDTLILNAGKSQLVFIIRNTEDIKRLQQYDLNKILDELGYKLTGDSTLIRNNQPVGDTIYVYKDIQERRDELKNEVKTRKYRRGTTNSFDIDFGLNNVLMDGDFPDVSDNLYAVKPWGSWYVGLNSIYRTRIAGPFLIEWGGGVSWYNFKFDNTRTRVVDNPDGIGFIETPEAPEVSYNKSKLTVVYVNASFVPMFDFTKGRSHRSGRDWTDDPIFGDKESNSFRFGAGGYVGYRIDSYTKFVEETNDKDKTKDHDGYHLENLRYGIRFRLGFRGTDVFLNYDLNNLFRENRGPELNAFSFGLTF